MAAMSRFGAFTVRTECARCGQPLPLNGPFNVAHCASCQADLPVHPGLWNVLLKKLDDEHDAMIEGAPGRLMQTIEGVQFHCSYMRSLPRCDKCSATLPLDVATTVERDLFCTGCGDGASVYPAPQWLRDIVPTAQQVYSVDRGAGPDARRAVPLGVVTEAPQPIVMPCPQCGGALQLGGEAERVVKCHFCTADVYLPDDLWKRLHPVRVIREWFVRFEGETSAQQEAARRRRREIENRNREAQEQASKEAADEEAGQELDVRIAALMSTAYTGVVVMYVIMLVALAWNVGASQWPALADARQPVGIGLLAAALISVISADILAGRPIQQRTGFDGSFMFFAQWFFMIFAVAMPVVGQGMALVMAFVRLGSSSVGGSTITDNGSTKYYPTKELPRGEGRPLGLVYLAMALLYPAIVLTLFFGNLLGQ